MVPAVIAASVALVVAVLTPAVTSWRARRQATADLFDDAVSALLISQTARHYPNSPGVVGHDWRPEEYRDFSMRMQQDGLEHFRKMQEEARIALARQEPFVPEIRREITQQWEIREEQETVIRRMIEARRSQAIKSERLFRLRRAPRQLP